MQNIYLELDWLKKSDDDLNKIIADIKKKKLSRKSLIELNKYFLNFSNSQIIFNYLKKLNKNTKLLQEYDKFTLGIISNSNIEFLIPSIVSYSLKYNLNLEIINAPFGQTLNFLSNENNFFYNKTLDAVLVAIDINGLALKNNNTDTSYEYISDIINLVNSKLKVPCIIQNLVDSEEKIFGNLDFQSNATPRNKILSINDKIKNNLKNNNYNIIYDVNRLAANVGLGIWYDPALYYLTKTPISKHAFSAYAENLSKTIAALKGKSKRLLIFDLDNTIWGGNIGDTGYEGIEIGNGTAKGEAFLQIQKYFLELRERGVLLAAASKNNSDIALKAFDKNNEVLIKNKHLSTYEINWKDKAQNILKICNDLKLGMQSAVFVDDNPFERNLVRKFLPEVTVPEMPSDPSLYCRYLYAANYFETVYFSKDDKIRAEFFESENKRVNLKKHNQNVESFLFKLKMKASISSFQQIDFKRLEQLITKSNQFNLTTKRYTYQDIKNITESTNYLTLQIRLSDIYGDSGLIAIIIVEKKENQFIIDTWIQSCRILERKVENLILDILIKEGIKCKIKKLIGLYKPTKKNLIVLNHYKKLGFKIVSKSKEKSTWKLSLEDYKKSLIPIELI